MPRGAAPSSPVRRAAAGLAKHPKAPATGRRAFSAAFSGLCASCPAAILPGDSIFYAPGNEAPSGLDCCGDRDDAELVVATHGATERDGDRELTVDVTTVMPRGRTAADACPLCWQIPSSNNTCGC